MAKDRRRGRRPAGTTDGAGNFSMDVWRTVGVLLTDDPQLEHEARLVLASLAIGQLVNNGADAGDMPATAEEYIAHLRTLHAAGWLGVDDDGVAYMSEPVLGPFGNVVDRVRMNSTDRRALSIMWREGI